MSDNLCVVCGSYWGCAHVVDLERLRLEYIAADGPTYRDRYGPHSNDGLPVDAALGTTGQVLASISQAWQQMGADLIQAVTAGMQQVNQAFEIMQLKLRAQAFGLAWADIEIAAQELVSTSALTFTDAATAVIDRMIVAGMADDSPMGKLGNALADIAEFIHRAMQSSPHRTLPRPRARMLSSEHPHQVSVRWDYTLHRARSPPRTPAGARRRGRLREPHPSIMRMRRPGDVNREQRSPAELGRGTDPPSSPGRQHSGRSPGRPLVRSWIRRTHV